MNDETSDEFCGPPKHLHPFGAVYLETERFLQMAAADPSLLGAGVNLIGGKRLPFRLGIDLAECSDDEL